MEPQSAGAAEWTMISVKADRTTVFGDESA
jgi:hypothetical protein